MIPSRIIEAKRDGASLATEELEGFLAGYLDGRVPDYQMAAFLMAVCFRGLDARETDVLVRSMLESGAVLDLGDLDGPKVDKHSTGGVGDKVSLVLAPLAAAVGLYVPMISGRGLGHTTGTLDKLEAIPGFRTGISLETFRGVLADVGCAMIGQTEEIAPLDRRLYALRDVTGTVPVIPLIAASIMSKKLAEGLDALVLDVKVGSGAFLPEESRALELARAMVSIGTARGLCTVALLTAMDRPLGRAVGNGLETREAIACLRGEGPDDLRELVVAEVGEMLRAGEPGVTEDEAQARVSGALASGAALERFVRLVEAQGGDPRVAEDPSRMAWAQERVDVSGRGKARSSAWSRARSDSGSCPSAAGGCAWRTGSTPRWASRWTSDPATGSGAAIGSARSTRATPRVPRRGRGSCGTRSTWARPLAPATGLAQGGGGRPLTVLAGAIRPRA